MAQHAYVLPPESRMGPLEDSERETLVKESFLNSKYETMVDNISAYERITGKAPAAPSQAGGGFSYSAEFNTPVQQPVYQPDYSQPAAAPEPVQEPAQEYGAYTFDVEVEPTPQMREIEQKVAAEQAASPSAGSKKAAASKETVESGGSALGELADNFLGKSGTRQVIRTTGGQIGREVGKVIGEAVLGKKGKTIGGNIGSTIGRNLFGTLLK